MAGQRSKGRHLRYHQKFSASSQKKFRGGPKFRDAGHFPAATGLIQSLGDSVSPIPMHQTSLSTTPLRRLIKEYTVDSARRMVELRAEKARSLGIVKRDTRYHAAMEGSA